LELLKGYLDDSQGDSVVSVAAAVGTVNGPWKTLADLWTDVLKEFGVPYFHSKEFTVSAGPFKSWKGDEPRRRRFVQALTEAASQCRLKGLYATVPVEDLAYLNNQTKAGIDIYALAVSLCFMEMSNIYGWRKSDCVLDRLDENMQRRIDLVDEYLSGDDRYAHWWSTHLLEYAARPKGSSSKEVKELQLADFLAWESRESTERIKGVSKKTPAQQRGSHWSGQRASAVLLGHAVAAQGRVWEYERLAEVYARRHSCMCWWTPPNERYTSD